MKCKLSVIIPCFNEERNLRLGVLEKVYHYLSQKKFSWEVIFVDDGSTDKSQFLIKKFISGYPNLRYIRINHEGKAAAVTKGVRQANGDYILFTDLDQATPLNQWDRLEPWFEKGFDIVIGSRNTIRRGAPFFRLAMARGFMILRNIILRLPFHDTQCGFKAFRKTVVNDIFRRVKIYGANRHITGSTVTAGFDVELLFIAKRLGYKIKEVPIEWHYQETRHVNPLSDSWEGFMGLIKIKWNSIKGVYDHGV
jgi:glycosyltransferase involved in cell wall biosynthesis